MWNEIDRENAVPARVVAMQRNLWRIAGEFGEYWAEPAGKLRLEAGAGADWPALGDWLEVELPRSSAVALVRAVLPRQNRLSRKASGKGAEEQIIAANVDTALVLTALDADFNPRRAERYIAQCWDSGVKPVLVLNKADACSDARAMVKEMERTALGAVVCVISAKTGQGMKQLKTLLKPQHTFVLLGSSGVGKSTLTNRLLGQSLQKVNSVRAGDSRGRHTTTARELFALPGGALLIDTPGLREFQLWDADEGLAHAFGDIHTLAVDCRFTDCQHQGEPGCAVQAAVQDGTLDSARLENCKKLLREHEFLRRKVDPQARAQEKQRIKRLTSEVREIYKHRKPG
jgi:ribosome biogenesis GTPase